MAVSLFDSGHPDQVTAAELKNHFYVHVQPIVAEIYEAVTSGGFFKSNPKKTRSAWVGYGFIALAVAVAGYFRTEMGPCGWLWLLRHWLCIRGHRPLGLRSSHAGQDRQRRE